ncbi:MAG: plastocyanin/azurin family copper-binding protein [Verrucomicrobiales bacterium]
MNWSRPIALSCLIAAVALAPYLGFAQEDASRKTLFLPKNPVAAAYILNRLSNQELQDAPRSEFVYVALLQRKGLDRKYRMEALEGLARLRQTDAATELLKAISDLDRKGEGSLASLNELSVLLLQNKPEVIKGKTDVIESLIAEAQLPFTRQMGYAALVTAEQSVELVWKRGQEQPEKLPDIILSIPLLRNQALRAPFYPLVTPLLQPNTNSEVLRAAITAVAAIPGHEAETFQSLATLLQQGVERSSSITSLQQIPRKVWPKERAEPLLQALIKDLQKVPDNERTEADFINAMQFATDLASLLPPEKAREANRTLRTLGVAVFVVRTLHEQMLYDVQLIVVEAGKPVQIVLVNEDSMPHNLVVVMPNSIEEIGVAAEGMPLEPDEQGRLYVPKSPKVIEATKMIDPGQQTKITFVAPSEPGDYEYVCTFPGHWRRMVGKLVVVKDVEAYLATHTPEETKVTEWKTEDLAPFVKEAVDKANTANGKKLFVNLGCLQCHQIGKEGFAYGPDLTDIYKRYNGDSAEVLRHILEPSVKIEQRYQNLEIETTDGESVYGLLAKENEKTITLQTGPAANLVQEIKKEDIASRKGLTSSMMPGGLLNTISKEEIGDLLAYLKSGGHATEHDHNH